VRRGPLLGGLDRDLACAIALGFVTDPHVIADPEMIWILDADRRPLASQSRWLNTPDPLDVATREYLAPRRALAGNHRDRGAATRKVFAAKAHVRRLLEARGVLRKARDAGLAVVGEELVLV
jgi:hypothetical protein